MVFKMDGSEIARLLASSKMSVSSKSFLVFKESRGKFFENLGMKTNSNKEIVRSDLQP